jgi:AraC family L-rhamnose operon regulatory protein RhaS
MKSSNPAIFLSPKATYHADGCEPLVKAVQRGEVRLEALVHCGYPGRPLPPKMLPEISTVGFWDATGTQSWGLDWHRNEGIELTYLARGKAAFMVDKKRYLLESGDLTVTRPWQAHRVGNPNVGACRLHWLIIDVGVRRPNQNWHWPAWLVLSPEELRRLTTLLRHNEQPVWRASEEIRQGMEKIGALVASATPTGAQTRLQLYINELFLALLDLLQKKNVVLDAGLASTRRTVEMFLADLREHLDHPWTLAEMAEHCGLGRSRFAEYCRQIVNMPPADYLVHCRVEAAKQMLQKEPGRSITDIALACGFQSSQYFATAFRRKTGKAPREFRAG